MFVMNRYLREIVISSLILLSSASFAADVSAANPNMDKQKQVNFEHEIYGSFLIVYVAAEYRFIAKKSERFAWYGAAGLDGSLGYGAYHVSGGVRYGLSENVNIYGGIGAVLLGGHSSTWGLAPEFKITQRFSSNSKIRIQWIGFSVGPGITRVSGSKKFDTIGYLQLPGVVFTF